MTLSNVGFQGTIGEFEWARYSALSDLDVVATVNAWKVSPGTGRQVVAAVGLATAAGVMSDLTTDPLTASLATPTNGQWYLIVRRIDWAKRTVTLESVPYATTPVTRPSEPPTAYPAINSQPGQVYDHVLAWAWVNSVNTSVVVIDLRKIAASQQARHERVRVASAADRDLVVPLPRQGDEVFREDLGVVDRYYGKYDPVTNKLGLVQAGWAYEGEWKPFTPTLVDWALGTGGTLAGQYRRVGDEVHVRVYAAFGTTGFRMNNPRMSAPIPFSSRSQGRYMWVGSGAWFNGAVGPLHVHRHESSATDVIFFANAISGSGDANIQPTTPLDLRAGMTWTLEYRYLL